MIRKRDMLGLIVSAAFLQSCSGKTRDERRNPDVVFYLYTGAGFDNAKYISALEVFAAQKHMNLSHSVGDKSAPVEFVRMMNHDVRLLLVEGFGDGEIVVTLFDVKKTSRKSKTYGAELSRAISRLPGVKISQTQRTETSASAVP